MPNDLVQSINAILPVIIVALWSCVLLLADLFIPKDRKGITALLSAFGLAVAFGNVIVRMGSPTNGFGGMVVVDNFANFICLLVLGSGLATVALSYDYLRRIQIRQGEYYALLMFSICGMMLMSMSSDLIMVFLSLEMLSIPLYVLAGIAIPRSKSEEAGIKYFLLGAFSSGFLVYGTALVYGASGSTSLQAIVSAVQTGQLNHTLLVIGAALILVGLGFKVAVVPFHMWTPDVYQGAPSAVTAFMAVGAKAAGFASLLRVFIIAFPSLAGSFTPVLWVIAVLTMVLGNFAAIAQKDIKRMLAYSSIAHAGYILMAMVPYGKSGISAETAASALFYLVAYAITNFAAWAVVVALEKSEEKGLQLDDYAGLGHKYPALAAVMAVAMLSFIGIPPTLGFLGKFFLFKTALQGGFVGLALIGVLTSLVSAYFYLRVIVIMYMREGDPVARQEPWLNLLIFVSGLSVVLLSIFATPLLRLASEAVLKLF